MQRSLRRGTKRRHLLRRAAAAEALWSMGDATSMGWLDVGLLAPVSVFEHTYSVKARAANRSEVVCSADKFQVAREQVRRRTGS